MGAGLNSSLLAAVAGLGLIVSAGCVSSDARAARAMQRLAAGDRETAMAWARALQQSAGNTHLGALEAGRIRMLDGDFAGSSAAFAEAVDAVLAQGDSGPVLRLGDAGADVLAGSLADDRLRPYRVPPYECVQALSYQMINALLLGRHEAAGVEARRAVFAQEALAARAAREARGQRNDLARSGHAGMAGQAQARAAAVLPATGRSVRENALAWYLCGVVFEIQGDLANAALSYRKAAELAPASACLRNDHLRTLRTQDPEAFRRLAAQTGAGVESSPGHGSGILLIVEESLVSRREALKLTLPVAGTLVAIDMPVVRDPAHVPWEMDVHVDGALRGACEPVVSLQALAVLDLEEKLPGVALRNATRAATRLAAQNLANRRSEGVRYGVLAATLVAAVAGQADLRSWRSLPMAAQVFRGHMAPGMRRLELRERATGRSLRFDVPVAEGETRLVWVAAPGGCATVATVSLIGTGEGTTCGIATLSSDGTRLDPAQRMEMEAVR